MDGSPTKKARAASPDGDAGKTEAALSANRGAVGVSALDCGPVRCNRTSTFYELLVRSVAVVKCLVRQGTSIAGSFIDDSCIGRLVAVFWPSHVGHGPSWYTLCSTSRCQQSDKRVPLTLFTTCDGSRFEGEITAFNKKSRKHRVRYTDGREEWSDLVTCGRFLSDDADGDAVVSTACLRHVSNTTTDQEGCPACLHVLLTWRSIDSLAKFCFTGPARTASGRRIATPCAIPLCGP